MWTVPKCQMSLYFKTNCVLVFRDISSEGHRVPVEVSRVQVPKPLYQIKAYRAGYKAKPRILK